MANIFQFTDINNDSDGMSLSSGDQVFIADGVSVDGGIDHSLHSGLTSNDSYVTADILGSVWGFQYGIHFAGTSGVGNYITIGVSGSVTGFISDAIQLNDGGNRIVNHGEIWGIGNDGIDITGAADNIDNRGHNTIVNTGTIDGFGGIGIEGGNSIIINSGYIGGSFFAISLGGASQPSQPSADFITNSGTIGVEGGDLTDNAASVDDIIVGQLTFKNTGTVLGAIDTGPSTILQLTNSGSTDQVSAQNEQSTIKNLAAGDIAFIELFNGGTQIHNSGYIAGMNASAGGVTITNSGEMGDVSLAGQGDTLTNTGTMGALTFINPGDEAGLVDVITNRGTIQQISVTGAAVIDVENHGLIAGPVTFQAAGGIYNGANGLIDGNIETYTGSNTLTGGVGAETFVVNGGADTIAGGGGNDTIDMFGNLNASQHIDGGDGSDRVVLDGNYGAGFTFGATTMVNVETLQLLNSFNYKLTTNNATVAAGQTLTVVAGALSAAHTLNFNGAAETNGHFKITGGLGGDTLTGGALSDTFVYMSAAQSSSTHFDTINAFTLPSTSSMSRAPSPRSTAPRAVRFRRRASIPISRRRQRPDTCSRTPRCW